MQNLYLYILRLPFTHCRRRPGIAHTDFYPAKLDKTILKRRENLERWCPLQSINHQRSPARRAPGSEFSTRFNVRGCDVVPSSEVAWINLAAGMDYVDTLNGERQRNRARMVCGRYSALGRTTRGRGGVPGGRSQFLSVNFDIHHSLRTLSGRKRMAPSHTNQLGTCIIRSAASNASYRHFRV